ncbi:LOB domain-containing protein 18, partial [Mucuna pruriens]
MSLHSSNSNSGGGGGSSSVGGGGSGIIGGSPCGACKFLRRKCVPGCIFAPYFDSEQGTSHFAAVHKVFGASNVSKLLLSIPVHRRLDAVISICYEAQSRLRDPVYGCVAHIFALQQQSISEKRYVPLIPSFAYIEIVVFCPKRERNKSEDWGKRKIRVGLAKPWN